MFYGKTDGFILFYFAQTQKKWIFFSLRFRSLIARAVRCRYEMMLGRGIQYHHRYNLRIACGSNLRDFSHTYLSNVGAFLMMKNWMWRNDDFVMMKTFEFQDWPKKLWKLQICNKYFLTSNWKSFVVDLQTEYVQNSSLKCKIECNSSIIQTTKALKLTE